MPNLAITEVIVVQATVGERIRERREARGWSRNKLALTAGVSQGNLSDIENGKVLSPSAKVLSKLARAALGTSVDYLVGTTDDPAPPSFSDVDVIRADMPLPPLGWDELSEEEKEAVRDITRRFEETIIADILRKKKERG